MTPFTEIGAAIEEAAWLAHAHNKPHCVYQRFDGLMEVTPENPDRNPMYTTGAPGVVTTEYRRAA
ncbi:hypothetical protein LZU96_08685 [Pantoea agglomerans]|uniref:hypothetical protein n=1 Tax=Pantoea TaxID=53335 RepID=UPI001F44739B|nr:MULTISPECIES: hypothetical protein [Pantoea]UIL53984.1 hypothetical protein LZU96_08685 [Pantoea agglomerans]